MAASANCGSRLTRRVSGPSRSTASTRESSFVQAVNRPRRDGKLYLNYDAGVQAKWRKDPAGYIKDADARFPTLLNK